MEWNFYEARQTFVCSMFCQQDGAQRSIFPINLILLTNKIVALIYSVTICAQNAKDCAQSGSPLNYGTVG